MAQARGRHLETDRIESFTDAVLAIVLTLLVLDLLPDQVEAVSDYARDWPRYLAYVVAFLTISSIWVNHHAVFSRINRADGAVFVLNLFILLGASLVPWPTAAISLALSGSESGPRVAAVGLYTVITGLICLPWALLDRHLARSPHLLTDRGDSDWFARHARVLVGTMLLAVAAFGLGLWSAVASMGLYLALVTAFVGARIREA